MLIVVNASKLKAQILCPLRFLINVINSFYFPSASSQFLVVGDMVQLRTTKKKHTPKKCIFWPNIVSHQTHKISGCAHESSCGNTYGNMFAKFTIVISVVVNAQQHLEFGVWTHSSAILTLAMNFFLSTYLTA